MIRQLEMWGRWWTSGLWQASVQIAVLVLLVGIASYMLRRSSPVVRYLLWCIVLVRLCVPMGLTLPSTAPQRPMLTPAQREQMRSEWRARFGNSTEEERRARIASFRERAERERAIMTAAGVVWVCGSSLIVLLIGVRAFCLRRRIRALPLATDPEFLALVADCRAQMGLKRSVQVRIASDDECPAPAVTALFRPVIILPHTLATTWSAEELKPILMHELAHVRRRDISINWLQIVLQTFYFFHPLVWLANWKIRVLREEACDDLSIAKLGGLRQAYSASLLRAIELANSARPRWGVVGLAERKSDLVKRLRRLVQPEYVPTHEPRWKVAAKVVALGGMCLMLSGMVPVQAGYGPPRGGCHGRGMCHGASACKGKSAASAETKAASEESTK
jgi:beta-lactamase regulating signal transducer with metallopeptidase domain